MTSYNTTARNVTTYQATGSSGQTFYLLTDILDFILAGENEDETIILSEGQEYGVVGRIITAFSTVARN